MHCITPNRRTLSEVEVVDFEKRRVPSKHYVYIINVTWNDGSDTVIYRRYSMFFDFQIILLETFPWEGGLKEPSARKIPFLPGKILFRRSHIRDVAQKRLKNINDYCKALIKLPNHIAHCDHVLDFFEVRPEDLNPNRERQRTEEPEISEISGPLFLEPYVAIADYLSTQQKELSITTGERLEVIEKNENGWWLVSNDDGDRGWVPGVYLEKPDGSSEDLVTKRAAPGQGEKYVTIHEYTAENADEISFGVGVTVEVLQKNLEGWWLIRYNGKQGNAPAPFLEKQQNWTLPNKVEIISSIRDLKQNLPHSSNDGSVANEGHGPPHVATSAIPVSSRVPASPLSPTSSYNARVLPTPKRSTIKRVTKRPVAPPPLPPGSTQEQTYEYLTIASFNANIPDGVSFEEDKKVEVLDKSPGGWWFVKVGEQEGWAPATYIEKREVVKPKPACPVRPKLPTVKKSNSTVTQKKENQFSALKHSAVRKGSLNSLTISSPILQNASSTSSDSSPAKRPLPPVPLSKTMSQPAPASDDAYEDIADTKKIGGGLRHVAAKTDSHSISSKEPPSKVDFRANLRPTSAAKPSTQSVSAKVPTRPPSLPSAKPKPSFTKQTSTQSSTKPIGFTKFGNIASQFEKCTEDSKTSDSSVGGFKARSNGRKNESQEKFNNVPPSIPAKPKPPAISAKPKVETKPSSSDGGTVTDFRSVLRSAQAKNSSNFGSVSSSNSPARKKSWGSNQSSPKGPSVPKKPTNLPFKPPGTSKPNGAGKAFDSKGSVTAALSTTKMAPVKPEWKPGEKPVLRRFQQNNNSNAENSTSKPVFTVAHAQIEVTRRPDLSETLLKRGSPDGQADSKFNSIDSRIPVSPPQRTKKLMKSLKNSRAVSKVKCESNVEKQQFAVAMSDYVGTEESAVSFFCGDVAQILDDSEPDWWYVKIGENIGWAPSSFFCIDDRNSQPASFSDQKSREICKADYDSVYSEIDSDPQRPRFPAKFVALADFHAQDDSMVSLKGGDVVTVTQEAQGGWWYATHLDNSSEGWVPSSYLEIYEM